MGPLAELDALQLCWCWACHVHLDRPRVFYILCCGCKRCPKATNHQHGCTCSNDAGQVGSIYGVECLEECCTELNADRARQRIELADLIASLDKETTDG